MISELLNGSKVLNKQEMKNVTGGAGPCPDGQTMYTCTVSYEGGGSFSGLACGTSKTATEKDIRMTHDDGGGGVTVKKSGRRQ